MCAVRISQLRDLAVQVQGSGGGRLAAAGIFQVGVLVALPLILSSEKIGQFGGC